MKSKWLIIREVVVAAMLTLGVLALVLMAAQWPYINNYLVGTLLK